MQPFIYTNINAKVMELVMPPTNQISNFTLFFNYVEKKYVINKAQIRNLRVKNETL